MKTLIVLALVLALTISIAAQRGKGRSRGGGRRGNKSRMPGMVFLSKDANAYYNNNKSAAITVSSHFESEYTLGRKIVFICSAKGDPRPHITWFQNMVELYVEGNNYHIHQWEWGQYMIKSKMEIDPASQRDSGLYECEANNKYGVDRKAFRTDFAIDFE